MRSTVSGLLIGVAFAGCGSSDPQATSTPTRPAEATAATTTSADTEPIGDKLSALCQDVNDEGAEFDQRVDQLASAEKYDELAKYLRASLEKARPFDEKVEQLDPPADERAAFRRYVEANQRLRRLLAQAAGAIERRAFDEMQEAGELAGQVSQVRLDAALELGADECG